MKNVCVAYFLKLSCICCDFQISGQNDGSFVGFQSFSFGRSYISESKFVISADITDFESFGLAVRGKIWG